MKIEITRGSNPLEPLFTRPLSPEGEAEKESLRFADALLAMMKQQGVTRAELARRLNAKPSRITALLSGEVNLTLQTMIRAANAVGAKYHHCLVPASKSVRWHVWSDDECHPAFSAPVNKVKQAPIEFTINEATANDAGAAA